MKDKNAVFAFELSVAGKDWSRVINAHTAGQAKQQYWRDVQESWPDLPYVAIRARKLGPARTSDEFKRTAAYRGKPDICCGQRVRVGDATGVIVGHNDNANFDVLFDADSLRYAGLRLNCHPDGVEVLK